MQQRWLEETYRGSEGIDNRRAYVVCNVDQPNVDNWLRTPMINVKGANRLHIEVVGLIFNFLLL
ncbi:unnamed protein product [Onchocerca flexuosa]|uniref:Eph LBD domain-containing protein n=1 Tax=Onchocerca flexuosa TaxID=387005 RepID=A0A183HSF6_9BILA|nr:unnamed protein product [Onchocerca flexuosa]